MTQNIKTLLKLKSLNIMKKKIILALTACLFAAGSIINIHLAQNNHNLDVSLADIAVMAQADGESGNGDDESGWRLYQHFNWYYQTTYYPFPPFVSVTKIAGHKATCSQTGTCAINCIDYTHDIRPNDTCADCNTWNNLCST